MLSSERLNRVLERRAENWDEMQSLTEAAEAEQRDLSGEEQEKWDRLEEQIRNDSKEIDRLHKELSLGAELDNDEPRSAHSGGGTTGEITYHDAFREYMRVGVGAMAPDKRDVLANNNDETRAQSVGTDSGGGYLVPEGFRQQIVETMQAFGGIRALAEIYQTSTGNPVVWPTVDDTANKGQILGENTQVSEQDVTFGQGTINAFTYSSNMVRVSNQLLQDSAFAMDSFLSGKLGERLGRATAEHYAVGSGSGQPQGLVTGAPVGVTGSTADSVSYEELIDTEHSLDPAYRTRGARWLLNDSTLAAIRKLTDNDGRPLWQPSVIGGVASTLNGYPYVIDQDIPGQASENKSILFGDIGRAYVIRDVLGTQLIRLNERYADFNQVAFVAFLRTDALVQDANAVTAFQQAV